MKITKDMNLGEVVMDNPKTIEVFFKYGLHCAGCGMANFESIEDGAKAHGFDSKKVKKLIDDLNKVEK